MTEQHTNHLLHRRRPTCEVTIGNVVIGGEHPIALQSMTSTPTMDTEASVEQSLRIASAGGEIVRLTAPGSREATNIGIIRKQLRERGCDIPVVADIHFNPKAALTAAECCDKVRINPGNFVDPGRTFAKLEFTDEEYADEISKIDKALEPLLKICREHGTALRIGVNHGSLSDRIMSRYGDTPAGMVESAMEFLRVCVARKFYNVVISIKASNVRVMVETTRRLVDAMEREGMTFPLHLGVTEAGDGEDARIKSAVGIGSLLAQGIGDTIRVSLSEEPENEIPVASAIAAYAGSTSTEAASYEAARGAFGADWVMPERRRSRAVGNVGGDNLPVVAYPARMGEFDPERTPDLFLMDSTGWIAYDAPEQGVDLQQHALRTAERIREKGCNRLILLSGSDVNAPEWMQAVFNRMKEMSLDNPVIIAMNYDSVGCGEGAKEEVVLRASIDLGRLLLNGVGDGVMVMASALSGAEVANLAFGLLQSTRLRMTRTEYISCPGCGRTLYDLQKTLKEIKDSTSQLKGLKIGVMGCIVNGPGEMADADYGYVGAGPGRVSLYKGKECIVKNIPAEEAVSRLVALIKENGDWK